MKKNVTIKDLELNAPFVDKQSGGLSSDPYSREEADRKFNEASRKLFETIKKIEKIDFVLFAVVIILVVMVATLVIDSFHINSAIYKEYSQKTESVEQTLKINHEMLKQIQQMSEDSKIDRKLIKELLQK